MPQLYDFGSYVIFFWVNEGTPTEPIHVHINEKRPVPNAAFPIRYE